MCTYRKFMGNRVQSPHLFDFPGISDFMRWLSFLSIGFAGQNTSMESILLVSRGAESLLIASILHRGPSTQASAD